MKAIAVVEIMVEGTYGTGKVKETFGRRCGFLIIYESCIKLLIVAGRLFEVR
jgi:hypothetical protein